MWEEWYGSCWIAEGATAQWQETACCSRNPPLRLHFAASRSPSNLLLEILAAAIGRDALSSPCRVCFLLSLFRSFSFLCVCWLFSFGRAHVNDVANITTCTNTCSSLTRHESLRFVHLIIKFKQYSSLDIEKERKNENERLKREEE